VLFQAGASVEGRELAARFADAIFAMTSNMDAATAYGTDVRARAVSYGRDPDDIVFMPRISPIIGRNHAEVEERYRAETELADIDDALNALSIFLGGHDFSRSRLYAPFSVVEIAQAKADRREPGVNLLAYVETTTQETFVRSALERRLTLREAALQFRTPKTDFVGTPSEVVDAMERWFGSASADGFIVRAGDQDDFLSTCIPLLQERGLFRMDYEADTFRGNLGLPPAANRYDAHPR
jgi:alkanesulfonate monooxygenase SsuD/methylene tetrahydromethanopterin reductase-like flavin-dependent oxidoreductase (luciferase family)